MKWFEVETFPLQTVIASERYWIRNLHLIFYIMFTCEHFLRNSFCFCRIFPSVCVLTGFIRIKCWWFSYQLFLYLLFPKLRVFQIRHRLCWSFDFPGTRQRVVPHLTCHSPWLFSSCLVIAIVYAPSQISLLLTPPVHRSQNRIIKLWLIFFTT